MIRHPPRSTRTDTLFPNTTLFRSFNPLYAEPEIARQIADSDTDVMVTLDLAALCNKVSAQIGKTRLKTVIVCPMAESLPYPKRLMFPIARRKEDRKSTRLNSSH